MSNEEQQLAADNATDLVETSEEVTGDTTAPEEPVETDEEKERRIAAEAAELEKKKEERAQRGIQKRIDELTADKYAERKRADELAAQNARILALLEQGKTPQNLASQAPTREQFDSYEDYLEAAATYKAEQKAEAAAKRAIEEFTKSQKEQQTITSQQAEQEEIAKRFTAQRAEVERKYPDYQEVIADWEPNLPDSVAETLMRIPEGALLSYHFAKNPALQAKFHDQPAYMHGVLLGELLATLKTSTKQTAAPSPGKPVTPKAAANENGYNGDPEGYYAWAQKNLR